MLVRLLSKLARRWPSVARTTQRLARRFQPRFTVGAVGVLFNDDQEVLLVEHVFHPVHPWGLPGGWVDANEMPHQAVEREFQEETGLIVEASQPVAVWSNGYWNNHIDMAFLMQITDPSTLNTISLSVELSDYRWCALDDLPPLLPDHRQIIKDAFHTHNGHISNTDS